eukprot:tig00020816_g14098.t1
MANSKGPRISKVASAANGAAAAASGGAPAPAVGASATPAAPAAWPGAGTAPGAPAAPADPNAYAAWQAQYAAWQAQQAHAAAAAAAYGASYPYTYAQAVAAPAASAATNAALAKAPWNTQAQQAATPAQPYANYFGGYYGGVAAPPASALAAAAASKPTTPTAAGAAAAGSFALGSHQLPAAGAPAAGAPAPGGIKFGWNPHKAEIKPKPPGIANDAAIAGAAAAAAAAAQIKKAAMPPATGGAPGAAAGGAGGGAAGGASHFPPNLKAWVERAFQRCKTDTDRTALEATLRKTITAVSSKGPGALWQHEWEKEPLPEVPSERPAAPVAPKPELKLSDGVGRKRANLFSLEEEEEPAGLPTSKKAKAKAAAQAALAAQSALHQQAARAGAQAAKKAKKAGIVAGAGADDAVEAERRSRRFKRFEQFLGAGDAASSASPLPIQFVSAASTSAAAAAAKRKQRIMYSAYGASPTNENDAGGQHDDPDAVDWGTIRGTCQNLEKQYLRLTSAPDPSTVRPAEVLKESLKMIKRKWKDQSCDWNYANEQLKSIRQDLTVQRIKDKFTVDVYETHARLALEKSDLNEYNQCQTQLKILYRSGVAGSQAEFSAYRILYNLRFNITADIATVLSELSVEERQQEGPVKHAIQTARSAMHNDYTAFFRLYREAPNMGGYLLDLFIDRVRASALKTIVRAYRPDVELHWVAKQLAFDSVPAVLEWFKKNKMAITLTPDRQSIDCKSTDGNLR